MIEYHFGIETLGMLEHTVHQFGALDTGMISRPVIHVSSGGKLTTLFHPGDQYRIKIGPRCIDGGSVSGWA